MATCSKPMVVSSGVWSGGLSQLTSVLVLLDAADPGQWSLERPVHPGTRVREPKRFRFDPVHEDDSDPGERVIGELAVGGTDEVLPREDLPIDRGASVLQ
jgi:hypothetical protein